MEEKVKTTVYLDGLAYRRLKELAEEKGSTAAAEIREAVAEYVAAAGPKTLPRSLSSGKSRRHDLSEKAETLLKGLGSR